MNRRCGEFLDDPNYRGVVGYTFVTTVANRTFNVDSGSPWTWEAVPRWAAGSHVGSLSPTLRGVVRVENVAAQYNQWDILVTPLQDRGWFESFAARLYRDALQRNDVTIGEQDYWADQIDFHSNCTWAAKWVQKHFLKTGEVTSIPLTNLTSRRRRIRRLYWTAFNRAPESDTVLDYWAGQILTESAWVAHVDYFVDGVTETTLAIEGLQGQQMGPCF